MEQMGFLNSSTFKSTISNTYSSSSCSSTSSTTSSPPAFLVIFLFDTLFCTYCECPQISSLQKINLAFLVTTQNNFQQGIALSIMIKQFVFLVNLNCTYRILHELSFSINFYETCKGNGVKQVSGELYTISRTSFMKFILK